MRTELQCQARGCDGCVVCDRDNYTYTELLEYRKWEAEIVPKIDKMFKEFANMEEV